MQQYNVIVTTTVRPRQQQEQLRKTTIQTTIQHVAHLPVVHVDDAAAAAANCVHLNSDLVTFLIPKEQLGKQTKNHGPPQPHSHEEPNSNNDHNQIIIKNSFLQFTRLKHVLLVPVPPISTRTRRRTTSQQEQQAILVLVQQHVIHNHTQKCCRGDRRHLFHQTVDNYLVIWVYILHKIIHKHVLLSSHRRR